MDKKNSIKHNKFKILSVGLALLSLGLIVTILLLVRNYGSKSETTETIGYHSNLDSLYADFDYTNFGTHDKHREFLVNKDYFSNQRYDVFYFYKTREQNFASPEIVTKLEKNRELIKEQKYNFEIGLTSVANKSISDITGEINLSDSAAQRIQLSLNQIKQPDLDKQEPYIFKNGKSLSPDLVRLDLREYGLVTPVRDQGQSGACWSFGSMSAYESNYLEINKSIIDASEQYVINCSGAGSAQNGGLAFKVFEWMTSNKKNIDDEKVSPFYGTDQQCPSTTPNTSFYAENWDFVDPQRNPNAIPSVKQIKNALCRYGVISASVYVDELFQFYIDGVFKENMNYEGTNHAVSIIGWDDRNNAWIIKNSWGSDWGNKCDFGSNFGYMYIDYSTNNIGKRAAWVKSKQN